MQNAAVTSLKSLASLARLSKVLTVAAAFLLICLVALPSAQASYFIVPATSAQLNPKARTHVVIAARGGGLNYSPQLAAVTKIRKIHDVYPNDQILFITAQQSDDNAARLQRMGFHQRTFHNEQLTAALLVQELAPYSQIASLHVYGHGTVATGLYLDGTSRDPRSSFGTELPSVGSLAGHFTSDAYVTLNGCNGAHYLAPTLSRLWNIPVAGAMTGTHFEALFTDGVFHSAEQKLAANFSATTQGSLRASQSCVDRNCLRMRPDNNSYRGIYGRYTQGLPFYKFFCVGFSQEKCLTGMARSILTTVSTHALTPSPSADAFAATVREWLCPDDLGDRNVNRRCQQELASFDLARTPMTSNAWDYSPFGGHLAQCDFKTCYPTAPQRCSATPDSVVRCAQTMPAPATANTFMMEYAAYLKGYRLLSSRR